MKESLDRSNMVTLDQAKILMEQAGVLPPHPMVDKYLQELHELITLGEKWEDKAKICLQARYVSSELL